MKMRAKHGFHSVEEGLVTAGDVFEASESRVEALREGGLAVRAPETTPLHIEEPAVAVEKKK